mmetsp:Transcript_41742/g.78066  ORF Transcript_41742/g.78066 Transcript_41742/m.78066 type:complete len:642 (+) Transcript_41742:3-1928(+)
MAGPVECSSVPGTRCLASPRRSTGRAGARSGRSSSGGVARTPPKTPAKSRSPRTVGCAGGRQGGAGSSTRAPAACRGGAAHASAICPGASSSATVPKRPLLSWAACEAVTASVWASARAHAEQAVAPKSDVAAGSASSASTLAREASPEAAHGEKRRRSNSRDCPKQGSGILAPVGPSQASQAPLSQLSQLSQTQPETEDALLNPAVDEAMSKAREVLRQAVEKTGENFGNVPAEVLGPLRKMVISAMAYWREVSSDLGKAASSATRFLDHQRRLYWRHEPWRGVNLGGWLLLEPGPSKELFQQHGPDAECEWDLMLQMREKLGAEGAARALREHRETFVTEEDFRRIHALGLNAVRIPFGYWVVTGPAEGDVFLGPCIEYLDRALSWCKAYGLQAVVDLHGAPGGESGDRPSGRKRSDWSWHDWRMSDSLAALRLLAARYQGHPAVAGISVCNEPSELIPAKVLCKYYDRAVRTIRKAGMPPDEVAILLPVYRTERLDEIWRLWSREYDGFVQHPNCAFDLHLYHCFGPWWQRKDLGQHIRMTKCHRKVLRRVPAVVGEWSLALAPNASFKEKAEEDEAMRSFATAQLEAYSQASHGWFFWNWRDCPQQQPEWDMRTCVDRRWLSKSQMTHVSSAKTGGC